MPITCRQSNFTREAFAKKHRLNLLTLPVHKSCHDPYKKDEEYFVHSIGPMAMDSYSGGEIWKDIVRRIQNQS